MLLGLIDMLIFMYLSIVCSEHLAHNLVEYRSRFEKQNERYDKYFKDLEQERDVWITPENMSSKITEDLFTSPSSTGLATKTSSLWTVHAMTLCIERVLSKDYLTSHEANSRAALTRGQQEFTKKAEVRAFLEQMVSNGQEREQMNELVEKFTKEFDVIGGFDNNKLYFDYVSYRSLIRCDVILCIHFLGICS